MGLTPATVGVGWAPLCVCQISKSHTTSQDGGVRDGFIIEFRPLGKVNPQTCARVVRKDPPFYFSCECVRSGSASVIVISHDSKWHRPGFLNFSTSDI